MKKSIGAQLALCPMPVTVGGTMNGAKADKSTLFAYTMGSTGTPIINDAPLIMECTVVDVCNSPNFESFICTIDDTRVEEKYLNSEGKIDYHIIKPVLFKFPTYEYLQTGDVLGKCLSFKNNND